MTKTGTFTIIHYTQFSTLIFWCYRNHVESIEFSNVSLEPVSRPIQIEESVTQPNQTDVLAGGDLGENLVKNVVKKRAGLFLEKLNNLYQMTW